MFAELTLQTVEQETNEVTVEARSLGDAGEGRWKRAVQDALAGGRLGALSVDPEYVVFMPCEYIPNIPNQLVNLN